MFDISRRNKNSIFNLDHFFSDIFPSDVFANGDKMMRVDIKETDNSYIFDVEIPGVNKEDIDLSITEDVLTISAKKETESNEENPKYLRKERKYGSYSRSFSIPNIDTENIKANYENGILSVILPKIAPVLPSKRNITIE